MKQIPLTHGKFALVDDADYESLNKHKWCGGKSKGTDYAIRWDGTKDCSAIHCMHRVIMNPPKDKQIDHIDGNGLNNQRSNLRICTDRQNKQNRQAYKNNRSGFKGVYWQPSCNKWQACITVEGKKVYLGCHFCLVKAAKAYDKAAIKYFKDFANTNFME